MQQVHAFKYLGVMFDDKAQNETPITHRIQQFSKSVNLLFPLLRNKFIPQKVKILLYKTILRPVLCYGHESWTLTKRTRSRVEAAEMRVLRLIEGVTRRDRIRNTEVRERLEVDGVGTITERAQLRWFGHLLRMSWDRIPKRWFDWKPNSKRPVGRPRMRWGQNVEEALQRRSTSTAEVIRERLYQDRKKWRKLTVT